VLAPLAVGNHIDHVELFVAAVRVMLDQVACQSFGFYENAYAMGTLCRRRHFVTHRRVWTCRQAPERAHLTVVAMLITTAAVRPGPPVQSCLPPAAGGLEWRCETVALGEHETRKLAAVFEYDSQVRAMGGSRALAEAVRRYHRFWGGAESLWRACEPRRGVSAPLPTASCRT
jgi:hypothetical protein